MNRDVLEAISEFGRDTGQYWSEDNARFEATNPNVLNRVGRALNPMTGFGSALGSLRDGISEGSLPQVGMSIAQAIPLFGQLRPAAKLLESYAFAPSIGATALKGTKDTALSVAMEEYQAKTPRGTPIKGY